MDTRIERGNIYVEYLKCLNKIKSPEKTLFEFIAGKTGGAEKRPFDSENRQAVFSKNPNIKINFDIRLEKLEAELITLVNKMMNDRVDLKKFTEDLVILYKHATNEMREALLEEIKSQETDLQGKENHQSPTASQMETAVDEAALSYLFNTITHASGASREPIWQLSNRIAHIYLEPNPTEALKNLLEGKVHAFCRSIMPDHKKSQSPTYVYIPPVFKTNNVLSLTLEMVGEEKFRNMLVSYLQFLLDTREPEKIYKEQVKILKTYCSHDKNLKKIFNEVKEIVKKPQQIHLARHATVFEEPKPINTALKAPLSEELKEKANIKKL